MIQRVIHRKDLRGTILEVGQRVAFNRSGDVVEGEIVRITPSATFIAAHPDFLQGWSGSPSRVRSSRSILVLDQ